MQVGCYTLTEKWQELKEVMGSDFVVGKTYQIQAQGFVGLCDLTAEPENDSEGVTLGDREAVFYEKGTGTLYARAYASGSVNISTVGE